MDDENNDELKLPKKGFTKAERKWLEQLLEAIRTVRALPGRNISISNNAEGQVINASDC